MLDNICFYSPFDAEEYARILEITQLSSLRRELSRTEGTGEQVVYSEWHETRMEIARALYNNVDYLLLDNPIILQDEELVKRVLLERRRQQKVTVVANNTHEYYFRFADSILVIGQHDCEFGDYPFLQKNPRSLFNRLLLDHMESVEEAEKR